MMYGKSVTKELLELDMMHWMWKHNIHIPIYCVLKTSMSKLQKWIQHETIRLG